MHLLCRKWDTPEKTAAEQETDLKGFRFLNPVDKQTNKIEIGGAEVRPAQLRTIFQNAAEVTRAVTKNQEKRWLNVGTRVRIVCMAEHFGGLKMTPNVYDEEDVSSLKNVLILCVLNIRPTRTFA